MDDTQLTQYVIMSVADIADGSVALAVQPGWAMGPFFPSNDLRFTDAFEIKNWDQLGVRRDWRNHPHAGSEYIAVTCGTLWVVFGVDPKDDGLIVESGRISVLAGHVIILRQGQWRRYECTDDAKGISVRNPRLGRTC